MDDEKEIFIDDENAGDIIGTLSERTLHSTLKSYYEPDTDKHEKRFLGFVADIVNESGIIEIQTGSFDRLRRKLDAFLAEIHVTVVYPATRYKWLTWIDPKTGETTSKRKSPKVGNAYAVYPELYKIKWLLTNPNLSVHIIMVDIEEYRKANRGLSDPKRAGRYGSVRSERIPVGLGDEIILDKPSDYRALMPSTLPEQFTSKDFAREAKLYIGQAQTALTVLNYVGAVERVGHNKSGYIYKIV